MRVYSLYDRKVKEYGNLVLASNDGTILRALKEGIRPDTTMGKYPEDFDLVCIGEFDPETGSLDGFGVDVISNVRTLLEGEA